MNQEEPKDRRCTPDTPEHYPPPPPTLTPESMAQRRMFEEGTQRLLSAYKETFGVGEGLPAVVWLLWGGKRGRHFLKMPYMRWFLECFLAHHVHKSLNVLYREFHAIAEAPDLLLVAPEARQDEERPGDDKDHAAGRDAEPAAVLDPSVFPVGQSTEPKVLFELEVVGLVDLVQAYVYDPYSGRRDDHPPERKTSTSSFSCVSPGRY